MKSNRKSKQSTKERFDKAKWWFTSEHSKGLSKIFVERGVGRPKCDGNELNEVTFVQPSATKTDIVKIVFRDKEEPLVFSICLFDFTANEISRKFEPFVKSTEAFVKHLKKVILGKDKEPLPEEEFAHELCDIETVDKLSNPTPPELKAKRPAPREIPDVDPLPSEVKKQKKGSATTHDNGNKFLDVIKKTHLIREDPYNVRSRMLVQPREEFLVRPLDPIFVAKLKVEMLERQSTFVKPLIAIVRNVVVKEDFKEEKLDDHILEVIGGNHRREAFAQLEEEGKLAKSSLVSMKVQLFTEMSQQQALRLAQLHNREDSIHHDLTTSDKVALCKNLLIQHFGKEKSASWRNMCSVIIGESETVLSNVLFVASELDDDIYDALVKVMNMYGELKLKGQRASKKVLKDGIGSGIASKLSFPYSKLRCLRGDVTNEELLELLNKVIETELSIQEIESELGRRKEMRALQNYFVKTTNSSSWTDAKDRYPTFTSEEVLQGFRGQVTRGVAKDKFKAFVQRAVALQSSQHQEATGTSSDINLVVMDCLQELNLATLSQKIKNFRGADLIFIDIPKKWRVEDLIRFLRMMKSLNLANNVEESRFVLFPATVSERLMMEHIQLSCEALKSVNAQDWHLAYYHNSLVTPTGNARMTNVILPYVISCGASNVPATNLMSVDNGPLTKEKDSGIVYNRQKPSQLFVDIIKLYNKDKSLHIVDACSGVGSCAIACSTLGLKCIILEKSVVKARLIRQRVNCS